MRTCLLLLPLVFAACEAPPQVVTRVSLGSFEVRLAGCGKLSILRSDGTVLLESDATGATGSLPALAGWRTATPDVRMLFGMFMFNEQAPDWSRASRLELESLDPDRLTLRAGQARVVLEPAGEGMLRVKWTAPAPANRLVQGFVCRAADRFFGLGALVHGTEHRGEVIPTWVSEQGVGKLRRANPYDGYPVQGDIHDTYLSVPVVLSNRGFGLLVQQSGRSLFHLCPDSSPDRWAVQTWNGTLEYLVIDGPDLPGVLRRLTTITSRPRVLPTWAMAPWIDAIGGEEQVLAMARRLRQEHVPASAIWTEDWIGGEEKLGGYHLKYQWQADTKLYPDLKGLSGKLHQMGFRFLGYFNAFLEEGRPQWKEALQKDYAIKDVQGKPLSFVGPLMVNSTLPDLSRKEVVAWMQSYLEGAAALGFDGWMADYGEWLPVEARLGDGTDGYQSHNLYPLMWQKANRQVWDDLRPDGDYLFFVRSGWTGTGGIAPVVWAGDQQTEFGGLDGMASVVPLMVNAGMSGVPVMTHDIGGYSTYGANVVPTTRELFFRWTELGAFSPVMRTHHGALAKQNWHWDTDAETIAHFRTYARLHVALYPYREVLAHQAAGSGMPMVRHPVLHHADDPDALRLADQYLLGPSLMVAPVLKAGATSREVYLPRAEGGWFDLFSGTRLSAGFHTVAAPLSKIPVFARAGTILPTLLAQVDTLDLADDKSVLDRTLADDGGLAVQVYLGASGNLELTDGTRLTVLQSGSTPSVELVTVDGKLSAPCAAGEADRGCHRKSGVSSMTVYLDDVTTFEVAGDGFEFHMAGAPRARRFEVTFYW